MKASYALPIELTWPSGKTGERPRPGRGTGIRKVAIVHDWLVTYAGAERVLEQLLVLYKDADLYCVCDFLPQNDRHFLNGKKPRTTFIQKLPFAQDKYRNYLPLMPLAIEQFDLSGYDLVISSSHAVAKGVLVGPDQIHVSYIHSPLRYAWDLQHKYLSESKITRGIKSFLARSILHYIRLWDVRSANGVDLFVANSSYIARRVEKTYRRGAEIVYPPVNIERFSIQEKKEDFYLTASRLVPYKCVPLIAEAFRKSGKQLVIVGDGPDRKLVEKIAKDYPNIQVLGYQPTDHLIALMRSAKAFVFAAEEDFGIVAVEAQACGTPVIAYARGGALESVREGETGMFFHEQTVEAIVAAVERFERSDDIKPEKCRKNAELFSENQFRRSLTALIESAVQ
jgi:glycosyltransferase involved in cell wall biosynthesis